MRTLASSARPSAFVRVRLSPVLLFACLLPALIALAVVSPASPVETAEIYTHLE